LTVYITRMVYSYLLLEFWLAMLKTSEIGLGLYRALGQITKHPMSAYKCDLRNNNEASDDMYNWDIPTTTATV